MISNQIIRNCIEELHEYTKADYAVFSDSASILASTFPIDDKCKSAVSGFLASEADYQTVGDYQFFKTSDIEELFVVVTRWNNENSYIFGKLAAVQIKNLAIAYREKYDKNNFFQNLILDNLLLVDIYNRAKKLHIEDTVERIVYLIETTGAEDDLPAQMLRELYSAQAGDYITAVDESSVILIKSLPKNYSDDYVKREAETIVDMMNTEAMIDARVSYGSVVKELKFISKSYKEAKMALEVGKIFYAEKKIDSYAELGIGRLIYQLPINLCKMFIDEIFKDNVLDNLDEETITTINQFFENDLNISKTSTQLYLHRNTLVYRIERIEKETGLDLRKFEDALTFKIALMVNSYTKYLEKQ